MYLLDLLDGPLKECERTIAERYPDVKVRFFKIQTGKRATCSNRFVCDQVTTLKGDATDEKIITDLCARALREERRLDVFFANVSAVWKSFNSFLLKMEDKLTE